MAKEIVTPERLVEETGSSVSWGAIFCGALITLAVQLLFTLLGSAIGMTAFDPEQGESLGRGATVGAGIYLFVTMLISFFVGGYVASRMAGFKLRMASILHGLSVWAVITAVFTFAIGTGIGNLLGGAINLASRGAQVAGQGMQQPGQQPGQVIQDKEKAAEALSQQLGIPQDQARRMIDEAERSARRFKQNAPEVAGQAADITAGTSWVAFFTLLFGAGAAILGGLLGSPFGRHRRHRREHVETRAA